MKGLTFDNFINHASNQNAYDSCFRLAHFEGERKSPIVLLGETGAGKSHLLWALVNHYRTNKVNVGVALISASDFPAKVKDLAVVPDKLTSGMPVVLLVDDLHLFSPKDIADLERVLYVVNEHGHTAVLATQIHPNVLPMLSGKLKAFLNSGVIIGMKALPKNNDSAIPEAALQQIVMLKRKIATLEESGAGLPKGAQGEGPWRGQEPVVSPEEVEAWQNGVAQILQRFEKQKALYEERFEALSKAADHVLAAATAGGEGRGTVSLIGNTAINGDLEDLDEARRVIAVKDEEIRHLRDTSQKLAEALEKQELEVNSVISGIRETVAGLAKNAVRVESGAQDEALYAESRKTLDAIAGQLEALESKVPVTQGAELPPLLDEFSDDPGLQEERQSQEGFLTTPNLEEERPS
jgi:hypothetical protein